MDGPAPRLTSVMGVAHALLATVGPHDTALILVAEFGWDLALQALVRLRGAPARVAFGRVWEHLVTEPVQSELREVYWGPMGAEE